MFEMSLCRMEGNRKMIDFGSLLTFFLMLDWEVTEENGATHVRLKKKKELEK